MREDQSVLEACWCDWPVVVSGGDNPCERAKCSRLCVESDRDQGFTCMCPPDMTLQRDGRTCLREWLNSFLG